MYSQSLGEVAGDHISYFCDNPKIRLSSGNQSEQMICQRDAHPRKEGFAQARRHEWGIQMKAFFKRF